MLNLCASLHVEPLEMQTKNATTKKAQHSIAVVFETG